MVLEQKPVEQGVLILAKTIVAIFDVFENAEKAAYEIRDKGLRTDNITIIVKDSGTNRVIKLRICKLVIAV